MTAQVAGKITVGQCVPALAGFVAAAEADITAELAGCASIQAGIGISPPSFAAQITILTNLIAALEAQAALSLSLGLPQVTVSLDVMLAAQLQLEAKLELLLKLLEAMATAGVAVITHTGLASTHGPEVQTQVNSIAPPTNAVQSVTFLATEPAVFAALTKVLFTG